MSETVRIRKIDIDNPIKEDCFDSAYAIYAYLEEAPDSRWGKYFDYAYRNGFDTSKRPVRLEGDRIKIVYAEGDDLQNHIDFVKGIVNAANEYCRRG